MSGCCRCWRCEPRELWYMPQDCPPVLISNPGETREEFEKRLGGSMTPEEKAVIQAAEAWLDFERREGREPGFKAPGNLAGAIEALRESRKPIVADFVGRNALDAARKLVADMQDRPKFTSRTERIATVGGFGVFVTVNRE